MNGNWFEIEHMMRSHQHDLLKEAADEHRARAIRQARARAVRPAPGLRAPSVAVSSGAAASVAAASVAVRLGAVLVAIGRRLQGASALADRAATCGVCGKPFAKVG